VLKKKAKKSGNDLQGDYPKGTIDHREVTLLWFEDSSDKKAQEAGAGKRGKHDKLTIKAALLEETAPLVDRVECYTKANNKKPVKLIYMLADVDQKDGFEPLKRLWNDELFLHCPQSPRIVVGYSMSGKPVVTNNEAIDICFDLAVMEYMEIREDDPNSFVTFYTPSLDKGRRATGMSRYLMVEASRDKRLAKRKPRLYDRLEKQTVDDALGTLPVAMIQWAGSNVRNLVGLGDEDISSTDTSQTCAQFITAAGARLREGVDNRLQFLICGNHLTDFAPEVMPPGFWRTIKMFACSINNLEKLSLSGKDVDMSALVELYASHNSIKTIDPGIAHLRNLRLLDLSANDLDRLPVEVFNLHNLEFLDVGSNKIGSIPSDIGQLTKLKRLHLDNNRLETLPFNLFLLENLEILELQSNQLRKLPSTLANLKKLNVINLDDNPPLKDIPKPVLLGGAQVLRNFLEETSQRGEFCFRTKLMIVGQENVGKTNLLRSLVKGASQKEKAAASANAASSSKAATESTNGREAGGTLRGRSQTRRGNTMVAQDVMSKEMFQTSGKTLSTDGIDIYNIHIETDFQLEDQNGKREEWKHLTFSVWDFAGQEIYYTTHSFFLTDRSIFVVVFNLLLGPENCRVDYWLNSVKARTPTAPIFLIGTHLDKVSKSDAIKTMEKLEKKYKKTFKIRGALAVSCESLENVETFIDQLLVAAKKEPYMGAKMPASYFALEDLCLMERRNKELLGVAPILTWSEVSLLAQKSNFMRIDESKPDSQDMFDSQLSVAIDVLHLLGSVVRFKDAGGGLENYVILDPQWVTKIFATIITTKQNFVRDGVIDVANLFTQLWRPFPPKLHPLLLNLLESFEIVFKLPDDLELAKQREALRKRQMSFMELDDQIAQYRTNRTLRTRDRGNISPLTVSLAINGKDRILIPALLPEARPDFQLTWPETDPDEKRVQFTRRYEFAFMPNGLFSRFMIRLLKFSDAQRYWRNGVLVRNRRIEDDQALIELNPKINQISISVRGHSPAEFFRTIIELLDSLLVNWFKISATIHAVCPKCIKAKMPEPTLFSKEECLESSAHGSHYLQCQADPEDNHLVTMETIAPDIAMSDFEGKRIDLEREVVVGKELGQGAYGTVHLGVYNKEQVAIKKLITEGKPEEMARDIYNEFRKEVWIMSGLQHPCIVNLKGYSLTPCLAMVMELIPHGDLYKYLNNKEVAGKLSWAMRLRIAWDIAKGMSFLHATDPPLLHRDMKSPNILMASLDPTAEVCAKIADFGLTGHVYAGNMAAQKARDRDVANPVWLAPEIIREEPYATAADVYPFGIILWELYAQAHPFDEFKYEFMTELERAIKDGKRPTIPEDCPENYAKFIRVCWDSDPAARPSFKSIIEDWLPPLINHYAPEILPAIENIEAIERLSVAVRKQESEVDADDKAWFNGTYLTSVETTLNDRIVDMVQTEDEVWCVSDRGALFSFNAESGKLLDRFANAVPLPQGGAPPKFIISIRYDFFTKRLIVMTKTGILSYKPSARNDMSPLWVRYEGYLTETDGVRRKKKKQKWAVVDEGVFTLFRNKGDEKPDLELLLSKVTMTVHMPGCFSLKYPDMGPEYFFSPSDDDPASEWVDRLELLIDVAKNDLSRMPSEPIFSAPSGVDLLALEVVGESMWGIGSNRCIYVWSWAHNQVKTETITFEKDCQVTKLSSLASVQLVRVGKTMWISYDNDIIRVNVEKLKVLEVLHGHSATIVSMITSGGDVWSYAADNVIRIWDQRSAKTVGTIKLHHFINSMVPLGSEILIAQESGLSVWSRAKREKIRDLEKRHEDPVSHMLIVHKDVTTVWSLSNVAIHVWK
jgi:serine/threonine protein kinase/GTPase SAR1 family protein